MLQEYASLKPLRASGEPATQSERAQEVHDLKRLVAKELAAASREIDKIVRVGGPN